MDTREACPACGDADALLALGIRQDRPHRWWPWLSRATYLYLCDHCDALVEVVAPDAPAAPATPAAVIRWSAA